MVALSYPTLNALEMPGVMTAEPQVLHPLEEVLAGAADGGFRHVGLDHFSLATWYARGRGDEDLVAVLSEHGLGCSDVGVLRIEDAASAELAAEHLAALARRVGARVCSAIMLADPGPQSIRTLRRCADILSAADVRIALEFVPYSPVRTLREAVEICSDVGWERCGLLLDTWMFFNGDNLWEELEALPASHIAEIQFDDAPNPIGDDLVHESRHRRVLPGRGQFDLARFVTTVTTNGYDGPVSLEVLGTGFRALAPAEQARRGLAAVAAYWPSHTAASDKEPVS